MASTWSPSGNTVTINDPDEQFAPYGGRHAYYAQLWQQMQGQQAQQAPARPDVATQLYDQYRPKFSEPSFAQYTEGGHPRYMIGGQDVTDDVYGQYGGMDRAGSSDVQSPDQIAGQMYSQRRQQAASAFMDRLKGNYPAGTQGSPLLADQRFQNLPPQQMQQVWQQVQGVPLQDSLRADQLGQSYGRQMTVADLDQMEYDQKAQAKRLAAIQAAASLYGGRGEFMNVINAPYNEEQNGVTIQDQNLQDQTYHITPEQQEYLRTQVNRALFPSYAIQPKQVQAPAVPAPLTAEQRRRRFDELNSRR